MVHLCTGVSANFEFATCLIYLLFAAGKFKQSLLGSITPKNACFRSKKAYACFGELPTFIW